jgi:ABC-2 type transport system permease protein
MKAFYAFCKKEFLESLRTYKLIVMVVVFFLLGLMNPFVAKIMPQLLNGSDLGNGIVLQMPEPTAMDSFSQFFRNMGQMGIIVLVIVFAGIIANEFTKGTLINILTKGMKRHTIIFAKFFVAFAIWTVSYLISLGVTWAYTAYYWKIGELPHTFLAFVSPWVYGLFLITLMIFGGVLFKTFYGSLIFTGGTVLIMNLLTISPHLQKYMPISLGGGTYALLSGDSVPGDFIPALIICICLTLALLTASVLLFDRKQV